MKKKVMLSIHEFELIDYQLVIEDSKIKCIM